jgi:hypothetical protein
MFQQHQSSVLNVELRSRRRQLQQSTVQNAVTQFLQVQSSAPNAAQQ